VRILAKGDSSLLQQLRDSAEKSLREKGIKALISKWTDPQDARGTLTLIATGKDIAATLLAREPDGGITLTGKVRIVKNKSDVEDLLDVLLSGYKRN